VLDGLTVTQGMTTPTRPGKQPRPVWEVSGRTQGLEAVFRELGGRPWRGAWSFFEDPTEALSELTEADRVTFAEQRKAERQRAEDRADRMAGYAANATARSDAAYERARQIGDRIPFGQPILVGHHSERGHRADLRRIDRAMRTSVEEAAKAEHYERRAELNDRKAEGDERHTMAFCVRRAEEAEALARKAERTLAGEDLWPGETLCEAERIRQEGFLADARERAAYWRGLIEAKGGVQFTKETLKPGMEVFIRREWWRVERCGPKNVRVVSLRTEHLTGYQRWVMSYPYAEVREVREAPGSAGQGCLDL